MNSKRYWEPWRARDWCASRMPYSKRMASKFPYRRVSLTRAGRAADEQTPIEFIMKAAVRASAKRKGKKKLAAPVKKRAKGKVPADSQFEKSLREWRLSEARKRQVPAFRIFSDRVLTSIISQCPRTAHELLAISGIGIATVEKYGEQIYRIVNDNVR